MKERDYNMKWYVTDGKGNIKSFNTHIEAQTFVKDHPDWYELMG